MQSRSESQVGKSLLDPSLSHNVSVLASLGRTISDVWSSTSQDRCYKAAHLACILYPSVIMGSATSILCLCCPRRKTPLSGPPTPEPLPHSIPEKPPSTPVPPAYPILFNDEFLVRLFGFLDPTERTDRAACISGALVCRTWTEPASRVLWEGPVDLLNLYGVLLQQPRHRGWKHDPDEMVKYLTKVIVSFGLFPVRLMSVLHIDRSRETARGSLHLVEVSHLQLAHPQAGNALGCSAPSCGGRPPENVPRTK